MFDNRDSIDFRAENIPALFRSIFIPTLLGMLFNAAFTLTDGIFVGHGVGPIGIAATTVAFPVMLFLTAFSILVGVGANTLFSIRMGEGRRDQASRILGNAFLLLEVFHECDLMLVDVCKRKRVFGAFLGIKAHGNTLNSPHIVYSGFLIKIS